MRKKIWLLSLGFLLTFVILINQIHSQWIGIGLRVSLVYLLLVLALAWDKRLWQWQLVRWFFAVLVAYLFLYPQVVSIITQLVGYGRLDFEFDLDWQNLLAIMDATNAEESKEYWLDHWWTFIKYLALWLLGSFVAIRGGNYLVEKSPWQPRWYLSGFLLVFVLGSLIFSPLVRSIHLIPNIQEGYQAYQVQKAAFNQLLKQANPQIPPLKKSPVVQRTLVLVIGESATSFDWQSYGYIRPTTPFIT